MTREQFEEVVEKAFADLPAEFRDQIDNVRIVVEDYPSADIRKQMGEGRSTLLGLYVGIPLPHRNTWYGSSPTVPDTIYLFQRNIEAQAGKGQDLERTIMEVFFHELGHFFGMNEKEVREALKNF